MRILCYHCNKRKEYGGTVSTVSGDMDFCVDCNSIAQIAMDIEKMSLGELPTSYGENGTQIWKAFNLGREYEKDRMKYNSNPKEVLVSGEQYNLEWEGKRFVGRYVSKTDSFEGGGWSIPRVDTKYKDWEIGS